MYYYIKKFWRPVLVAGMTVLTPVSLVYGQGRGMGPSGADSGYHSGSAATGHHGTSGSTDPSHKGEARDAARNATAKGNDQDVQQRIRQALLDDEGLAPYAGGINIEVQGGHVTLRGPVKTEKDKADISAKAQKVAGVTELDNQMQVAPNLGGTTGGSVESTPPKSIAPRGDDRRGSVGPGYRAASAFPFVGANSSASVGIVKVGSFPSTESQRQPAAEKQALAGSGGMHEEDRTGTSGPSGTRSTSPLNTGAIDPIGRTTKSAGDYAVTENDRALASRIRLALNGNPEVPVTEENLHIKVDNGDVTLQGWVNSERERTTLTDKVRAMSGVKNVNNQLEVRAGSLSRNP